MSRAAALLAHHAVLDLETTGLSAARDEVIELGVLFVEGGVPVRRIDERFRPSRPVPLAVARLTGLSDADLADRPLFGSYLPTLRDALRGWTVVAHNAAFERSFLGGLFDDLRAPVLDTCELLHLLHPELDSHALDALVRWAGVRERAAHRALTDCEDTLAVTLHALEQCLAQGRAEDVAELVSLLAPQPAQAGLGLAGPGQEPLVELLTRLAEACAQTRAPLALSPSSTHLPTPPERRRALERSQVPAPTPEMLEALLGPGGPVARSQPGWAERPSQREMARRVARTLDEGGVLAVEAGTGTGKSLGYLAPAALYAARTGQKVAVAPHTRQLQDQLLQKELPRLHLATQGAFGYAALKGQSNYACRRLVLEQTPVEADAPRELRMARAYLRAFVRRRPEADLDRVSGWFKERYPPLTALVEDARSDSATTLAERCPHFAQCAYHSAVAQAREADVLVINQALALAWPARYPPFSHVVLDEAHEVEDALTQAMALELSEGTLQRLVERVSGGPTRRGLAANLDRALTQGKVPPEVRALVDELRQLSGYLSTDGAVLRDALLSFCAAEAVTRGESGTSGECRLQSRARGSRGWLRIRDALLDLRRDAERLCELLGGRLPLAVPSLATAHLPLEREVAGLLAGAKDLSAFVEEVADRPAPSRFYQASVRDEWSIASYPIDVAQAFQADFLSRMRAVVLSSATLGLPDARGRPWVLERLGVEEVAEQLQLGSPFHLKERTLVVLVTDAPSPGDPAFVDWAAGRISGLAQFMGGRVLGLFASSRRLEAVAQRAREALEPLGIEVLRQSAGSARALAARQERDAGTVLLGTRSFWQGVDIPGPGVGCVFIDKLPLEPHTRPLVEAREERLGGRAGDWSGFMRYRLPRALLLLRQGVGRLIRSTEDRGVVVIADPGSARYRPLLLEALSDYRVEALPWATARLRLREALVAMGLAGPRGVSPASPSAPPPAA